MNHCTELIDEREIDNERVGEHSDGEFQQD